jgi:arylsulfatase A-like enzyme
MFKPTMNFTRGFLSYDFIRGYESDNYRGGVLSPEALKPFVRYPVPESHPVLTQYLLNSRGRHEEADWLTAQVFIRAKNWVSDHKGAKPFMLWIDSFGPHEPWDPPRSYVDPVYGLYTGIEFIYPYGMTKHQLTAREAERIRHLYLGSLTFVDHWVGEFIDSLKAQGLWKNTIVMIVSDHGTELLEHGRFSKYQGHLFAHNTQLIWTIRHPERTGRTEVSDFVQSHDLYPTVLGLLGINKGAVPGDNVWPSTSPERTTLRDWIVSGWGNYASVRDYKWNYIVNFEDPEADERLYNLEEDPGEQVDVSKFHQTMVRIMRRRLEDFLQQTLPARLGDVVKPSVAPIRRYYRSSVSQDKANSGFV